MFVIDVELFWKHGTGRFYAVCCICLVHSLESREKRTFMVQHLSQLWVSFSSLIASVSTVTAVDNNPTLMNTHKPWLTVCHVIWRGEIPQLKTKCPPYLSPTPSCSIETPLINWWQWLAFMTIFVFCCCFFRSPFHLPFFFLSLCHLCLCATTSYIGWTRQSCSVPYAPRMGVYYW